MTRDAWQMFFQTWFYPVLSLCLGVLALCMFAYGQNSLALREHNQAQRLQQLYASLQLAVPVGQNFSSVWGRWSPSFKAYCTEDIQARRLSCQGLPYEETLRLTSAFRFWPHAPIKNLHFQPLSANTWQMVVDYR